MRMIVVGKLCECGCGQRCRGNYKTGHKSVQFCECNCGILTTPGRKFVHGHDLKANHFSLPKGTKLSKEIIQTMKISKRRSLYPDWTEEEIEFDILHESDKSLCLCGCGKNTKSRNSKFCAGHNHVGVPSWNKGKELTPIHIANIVKHNGHKKFPYISSTGKVIKMRSRWEVAYAHFLDSEDIIWQYESKGFRLSTGRLYYPDFFLPESNEWHEVKGFMRKSAKEKIDLFKKEYSKEKLVLISEMILNRLTFALISFKGNEVIIS